MILIYACLIFAMYISVSTIVLGFWGQSTIGTIDSYESRLDNSRAGDSRSRTVSKSYYFSVDAEEYRGYVMYMSDEAWPRLSQGQTRTERISYLPCFPYINKPSSLAEFNQMGELAILYHFASPFGCLFLIFLVTSTVTRKKKPRAKRLNRSVSSHRNTRGESDMFCSNCGKKVQDGALFCSECGHSVQKPDRETCASCGKALPGSADFCVQCGTKNTAEAEQQKSSSAKAGFSDYYNHPEILEAARQNRKTGIGCLLVMTLVPLLGFPIAGLLMQDFPFGESIIVGLGIALVMLVANLIALYRAKRPMWEGVVENKFSKERSRRESKDDNSYTTYTEYSTIVRTQNGKKKTIVERDSRRDMYDYLSVGDRVRYHPAFGTYEKYDKSKDRIIYCNVCSMMNPIKNERCKRCNNLLFK